jgi:HSP20 family protein
MGDALPGGHMTHDQLSPLLHCFIDTQRCSTATRWAPAADLYHIPEGWLLKLELAGVRSEDISVTVNGRHLTVTGTRRDCPDKRPVSHELMEIAYGEFERTVEFPVDLAAAGITADYRDGMFRVAVRTSGAAVGEG